MTTATKSTKVDAKTFGWEGERKELTPARGYDLLARYRQAAKALHDAKQAAKDIEQEIMQEMGGYEHMSIDGQDFFHWPWVDASALDAKELKEKEPLVYLKYFKTKKKGTRRFRVEGTVGVD
jgi:predicted phage-related endonuclease